MPKPNFFFNHHTLSFERVERSIRKQLSKGFVFFMVLIAYSVAVLFVGFSYFDSPKEKGLKRELSEMRFQYDVLNDRLDKVVHVMEDIQDRDDNIYRVIFEAEPIPGSMRKAGFGGANRYAKLDGFNNSDILIETTQKLDQITSQMVVQSKSFDEVYKMAINKTTFLASIPAIQPIKNQDLKRLSSYFGYRIDPFYKVTKFHEGVDFSAPVGTEIYATGDGIVKGIQEAKREYGNHIAIDHGFGFVTFYAHLSKILVRNGQKITRGQVIGYVGNTGKSTSPHLHYEVRKNGRVIDPINYFFNDLTPLEYERILELSSRPSQTMD
jgi:murein DD-endopeptidase MepM/ murein hydrolase activator NlpD